MIFTERRELLDGFRRGDKAALLEVYRYYVSDVARFLTRGFSFDSEGRPCSFRGFRGGYEIEAALQEIFRRAFEERARLAYNGIDPYRPYLMRIARNAVINDLKSRHPILFRFRVGRPVILEEGPAVGDPDLTTSPEHSPEEILESQEVARLVSEFKASLDERGLGVFSSRFEEGLSAEAAAKKLGLTRSQVRTTETKVRSRFLEHMHRSGYLTSFKKSSVFLEESAAAIAAFLSLWSMT
jgi:RNA polymerase sigma-70 factor (ECF subfamily)